MLINKLDNVEIDLTNGHKYAIRDIPCGENIIKYGNPIGHAIADIKKGEHIHTHNMKTHLSSVKLSIFIFNNSRQICFHIVSMYMLTFFYVTRCVSYRIAVFDYILSVLYIAKSILMTVREIYLNVIKLVN